MRPRVVVLSMILSISAAVPAARVAACSLCYCGDPTFTLVGSQIFQQRSWRFGVDLDRFAKDQVAIEDPTLRERESEERLTLNVSYSASRRLTLVARLPFAHRTLETGPETSRLTGLSDPEVVGHFRLFKSQRRPGTWLSLSGGVRTSWGQNDRLVGGERAEEHIQPGTGAYAGALGLTFSRLAGAQGALFGSVLGRVNGRNDAGYRYGSVLLANLAYERQVRSRLNGILELNFRTAERDEIVRGERDPDTGGAVLYLSPRVTFKLTPKLWLRAGVQVPVVERLFGDQNEKVNLLTGFTVRY